MFYLGEPKRQTDIQLYQSTQEEMRKVAIMDAEPASELPYAFNGI